MNRRGRLAWTLMVTTLPLLCSPAFAGETSAATRWFDAAVRSDAAGNAPLAFSLYRKAAEAGLPTAEFNVAVMLDSGRGVSSDLAEASTWYARAASHGEARAAYNLGQLYEVGEGVPRNIGMARVWFASSGLAAARERLATLRVSSKAETALSRIPPQPIAPTDGARVDSRVGGFEFVWTSIPQPQQVKFFIELRAFDAKGSHEVFSSFLKQSSIFAEMPVTEGDYAWRVTCIAEHAGEYVTGDWIRFTAAPSRQPAVNLFNAAEPGSSK